MHESCAVRFRVGLEGALVSFWESAWAVAVAIDLEVGHLGDGNPREGDDMLISGASKQISPDPAILFQLFEID